MKPKVRQITAIEVKALLNKIFVQHDYPFQNCLNCLNFRVETEICGLCNMRPPAKIIVYGCDLYEDKEDIPF